MHDSRAHDVTIHWRSWLANRWAPAAVAHRRTRYAVRLIGLVIAVMLAFGLAGGPSVAPTVVSSASVDTATQPAHGFHLLEASISDIHAAMRSGQLTCRGLVQMYMD